DYYCVIWHNNAWLF
nr:immunoglobulin light chain junction region [Macaca mulatta]MOX83053.1 immunoglobulin light chain junction region [Macaca mulatta]